MHFSFLKNFPDTLSSKTALSFACILSGFLYCLGQTTGSTFAQNGYTVVFIFFLILLFLLNLDLLKKDKLEYSFILFQLFFLNISIAASAQLLNSPTTFFWVDDSMKTHIVESLKFTDFFKGLSTSGDLSVASGWSTHAVTGLMVAIFGMNTFATILAQLFFKLIATFFIYKTSLTLWGKKVGLISILFYGLCPTIFFYTLVLYKESAVQAYVAAFAYFTLKVFLDRKYYLVPALILAFYLLLHERFYLAYLQLITIALIGRSVFMKQKFVHNVILGVLGIILLFLFYKHKTFAIADLPETLKHYRYLHSNYTDVINQYNYDIPYPAAFIKILFSPYFTPNKFIIFTNFSTLLTWGSFINQFLILMSVLGFIKLVRKDLLHLYLWIPFIIFLLCAAYISPWSGRLRDSFFPFIACYSAYYIYNNKYFQKYILRIKAPE